MSLFIPCPTSLRGLVPPSLLSVAFPQESLRNTEVEQYVSKGGPWTCINGISCKLVKSANFMSRLLSSESESLGKGARNQYFNKTFR